MIGGRNKQKKAIREGMASYYLSWAKGFNLPK